MAATSNWSTTTDVCMVYDTRTGPERVVAPSPPHTGTCHVRSARMSFSLRDARETAHTWEACMPSSRLLLQTVLIGVAALAAVEPALAISLTRGPYLGRPSDGSVAVIWNTDTAADSRVDYAAPDGAAHRHVARCGHAPRGRHRRVAVRRRGQLPGLLGRRRARTREFVPRPPGWHGNALPLRRHRRHGRGRLRAHRHRDRLVESGADFAVHTGDVVYPTGAQQNYDKTFFLPLARWSLRGPVLPALGNHDVMTSRGAAYITNFVGAPPNGVTRNSRFYAIRQANALFVCLDVDKARTTAPIRRSTNGSCARSPTRPRRGSSCTSTSRRTAPATPTTSSA